MTVSEEPTPGEAREAGGVSAAGRRSTGRFTHCGWFPRMPAVA